MANAYKCDACGKFYLENETKIKFLDYRKPTTCNHISVISRDGPLDKRFDLCDECLAKILDMLHVESSKEKENAKEK